MTGTNKSGNIRQIKTGMNALTPHLALLSIVTTGIGVAMMRMGIGRGRLVRTAFCQACSD